ncbi:dynein heavy chain 2, cytosolic [Schistosoma bovis]|uniref:Dynein heavy chain 2, cytosolic n=1 Tax=Schistosoma bovis TaxID=6184 RepID=A0A430QBQ0_SCHBO|nr:dynein heavy chain 2, cytosolic [Schistosoma bovis]
MDPRSQFIFSTAQTYFQLDSINLNELENERHVSSFLNCLNIFTLACYLGKNGSLLFFNEIVHHDNTKQMLVFVKLQPTYLNEKNYKTNVMVCSIPGSPVLSFYTSISKLFAPLLLKGDDKSMLQDPKIQIALTNLAAGLSSIVSEGDGSENMTSIFTLTDEVNYWRNKSRCCSNNNVDEMKQCELFASLLESSAKECNRIESLSQSALDSNIDSLGLSTHCANSTQKQPSFGVFLTDLIDILDSLLIDTLDELWRCTDPRVKQAIQLSVEACERWIKSSDLLTQQLWPRYTPHPWNGPLPNLAYLIQFKNRLNEILNLRGLYEQLYYFTTPIEHNQFNMDSGLHNIMFNTFEFDNLKQETISPLLKQFINPLAYNPYTIEQWQSVIQLIDIRLQPIEESSGVTYPSRTVANQILMEFQKFQYLIHRPIAAKILQSERELLLGYLEVSLKEFHEEFLAKSNTANSNPHYHQEQSQKKSSTIVVRNISDCINQMLWGGQMKCRIQEEFTLEALSLIEQIEDWHNEQFQAWSRDRLLSLSTTKESNQSSLAFDPNGPLLNLSTVDGHLEVGFPDGLVQLQREVAHFYNSIDSEMLPFQKPLMLNSALAFERLIKSYNCKQNFTKENLLNSITWNQTEQIIKLLDIDLLRNQSKWRNELNEMRYQLSEIATNGGYPANHMAPWRAFLDHQLYKVLEYQYRRGLEEISERMPEMRVDMIKAKYYRELKKFICIPNNFRGFNEFIPSVDDNYSNNNSTDRMTTTSISNMNKHIFSCIIDNQESGLRICYKKAEFLFTRLFGSLEQFQDWVILGCLNLDDFVDLHCRDLDDYERNFKALKIRSRDIEKLPNEIRIDCIIVNCLPVKTAIDSLLQNLFDTLQNCLRRSIHVDLVAADGFLTDSLEKLSSRPQTIDELIAAKSQYNEYSKTINHLNDQIQCAERKNQLLSTVSGNGVTTIAAVKTKWEKFNAMMESFQLMMNEQLEILKLNVINETNVYFNNLERFKSRWNQLKPGKNVLDSNSNNNELCLSAVTMIKEYETEFREFELMRQKRDYEYFDMPKPEFSLVSELANDLNEYSLM